MDFKQYIRMDERQRERIQKLCGQYKAMYEVPETSGPAFLIVAPSGNDSTMEEQLADPLLMLRAQLDTLKTHLMLEDDHVPTVRVEFGTPQVAAAFGCELCIPTNSLPAAGTHVLANARDIHDMPTPSLEAGWYGKLREFTEVFLSHLPEGVHIQHPDIQSPFNTAHLVRGNDILTDFYDDPEAVEALLDRIADYMILLVPHLKKMISADREWFFDYGALWKGTARMSNCSMHMIRPEMYRKHVMPRDIRVLREIGGGRMHYCGTADEVIDDFFRVPLISGFDYGREPRDLWDLCKRAPRQVIIMHSCDAEDDSICRLVAGDWPSKRNIIVKAAVKSLEEGADLLRELRRSASSFFCR